MNAPASHPVEIRTTPLCPMCGGVPEPDEKRCRHCGELLPATEQSAEELTEVMRKLEQNLVIQIFLWSVTLLIPCLILARAANAWASPWLWLPCLIFEVAIVYGLGTRNLEAISISAVMQIPVAICFLSFVIGFGSGLLLLSSIGLSLSLICTGFAGFRYANQIREAGYDVQTFTVIDEAAPDPTKFR